MDVDDFAQGFALYIGAIVAFVGAAAVVLIVWWQRSARTGGRAAPPRRALPVAVWQAALPALGAVGMRPISAEGCARDLEGGGATLYLRFEPSEGAIYGWIERAASGCVLERFVGARAEMRAGARGGPPLRAFAIEAVGELMGRLPRGANLEVVAPEIPGQTYALRLTSPLWAADDAALAAQVLVTLDDAARRPAPAGSLGLAKLPPVVQHWRAAAASLAAIGLQELDAECYWGTAGGAGATVYLKLEVADGGVHGWIERAAPGGPLEAFVGATVTFSPGEHAYSAIARFVLGAVGEPFAALPRGARLEIKAPEIPGDSYTLRLVSPLVRPDHAALVARILRTLDDAARHAAPAGMHAATHLPPAVVAWQAAGPSLQALGMQRLDAECLTRSIDPAGGMLFLRFEVHDAKARGWIKRACPDGMIEQFRGHHAELGPSDRGRSPLAQYAASAVFDLFSSLARSARLSVKAPEIPGDDYELSLEAPLASPDVPATIVRTLLTLDAAARAPRR